MTEAEIVERSHWICCPICNNGRCVRWTEKCEARQWADKKMKEEGETDE